MKIQANITNYSNPQFKSLYLIRGKEKDLCKFKDAWDANCRKGQRLIEQNEALPGNIPIFGDTVYLGGLMCKNYRNSALLVGTNEDTGIITKYKEQERWGSVAQAMRSVGIKDQYSDRGIDFKMGVIMASSSKPVQELDYKSIKKALKSGKFNMTTGNIEY